MPEPAATIAEIARVMKPHAILVDHAGQRMVNETSSYMAVGRGIYERQATTPAVPAWLVMDIRHRKRYAFTFQPPGKIPKSWIRRELWTSTVMTVIAGRLRDGFAGSTTSVVPQPPREIPSLVSRGWR